MGAKLKIIIAMTAFGTMSIFVKNIFLSSGELALYRAIIAAAVIVLYKLVIEKRLIATEMKRDLPILFLSGMIMALNWILFFQAYKYTTVSIATLSYYFAPVMVMIASPIIFKEKLTVKQIFCFVMASIGLIMIIGVSGFDKSNTNIIGIGFGLGAAVLYAIIVLLNKSIKNVSGIDKTLIQFFAAIIVLVPYVLLTTGINIGSLSGFGIINLLILGAFHTGICYCLYFASLKDLKGQEVSILSYIDPLVAVVVSVTILGEAILPIQIIGGMMILGFTLLNEIKLKPVGRLVTTKEPAGIEDEI